MDIADKEIADNPETKEDSTEPSAELDVTALLPMGTPARKILTAEEFANVKERFSQPANPAKGLKPRFDAGVNLWRTTLRSKLLIASEVSNKPTFASGRTLGGTPPGEACIK